MSSRRRGSSGNIGIASILPGGAALNGATGSPDGLDLTALTRHRRKSRGAVAVDLNQLDAMISSSSNSGVGGGFTLTRQGSTGSDRDEKKTTPRSGRRHSRTGSISGLTAEQAMALSAQYGAGTDSSGYTDKEHSGTSSFEDALGDKGSRPSTGSLSRRGSGSGLSLSFGSIPLVGGLSDSNPAMQALKRRGSFSGSNTQVGSSKRRGSFDGQHTIGVSSTSSSSSRRGSHESEGGNGGVISSKHDAAFEKKLVASAQKARAQYKGRSIQSIRKSPKYGISNASTQRGVTVISRNICLGGRDDASDLATLKKYGITHVLNVAAQLPNYQEEELICLKIPLHDSEDTDIIKAVPLASAFIGRAEDIDGRVLVHCISGVSRSTTIILMHFMQKHRIILKDAYDYVHSCRPWVAPNEGFKLQLARMECASWGSSSVATPNSGPAWNFYAWNSEKTTVSVMKAVEKDKAAGKGDCMDSILNMLFGV